MFYNIYLTDFVHMIFGKGKIRPDVSLSNNDNIIADQRNPLENSTHIYSLI